MKLEHGKTYIARNGAVVNVEWRGWGNGIIDKGINYPWTSTFTHQGRTRFMGWLEDGTWSPFKPESEWDLVCEYSPPKCVTAGTGCWPNKRKVWINVYRGQQTRNGWSDPGRLTSSHPGMYFFETYDLAKKAAVGRNDTSYMGTVEVEI